jgi:hypothetical protein
MADTSSNTWVKKYILGELPQILNSKPPSPLFHEFIFCHLLFSILSKRREEIEDRRGKREDRR